jgi:SAM-dependent methyltransferase
VVPSAREVYFDRAAANWNAHTAQCSSIPVFRRWFREVRLRPGEAVIDVGCGTGRLLPWIWGRIQPNGVLYAVDISREMLRVARQGLPRIPARYLKASAVRLPLPEGVCDVAIVLNTFAHIPSKRRALTELHRVLRAGGRLWIVHLAGRKRLAEIHARAGGPIKNDRIPEPEGLARMMHEAGLVRVSVQDQEELFVASARRRGKQK